MLPRPPSFAVLNDSGLQTPLSCVIAFDSRIRRAGLREPRQQIQVGSLSISSPFPLSPSPTRDRTNVFDYSSPLKDHRRKDVDFQRHPYWLRLRFHRLNIHDGRCSRRRRRCKNRITGLIALYDTIIYYIIVFLNQLV